MSWFLHLLTWFSFSFPIYRHPADESPPLLPFSQTVSLIREQVQKILNHPVNHVLIQHYRSGADYISEHSDKTIDVVRGSNIVNVSLGAQRVMTLRMKKDGAQRLPDAETATSRPTQRIPLPHNSMFVMGPETNKKWLHGINHDNRPFQQKGEAERYQNGERISLTFRHIGTFLTKDMSMIYGQGSTGIADEDTTENATEGSLTKSDKKRVVSSMEKDNPDTPRKLIEAFGKENGQSDFDWDKWYGRGSNVLHLMVDKAE
jgi:alkylated DNA repair dioxygenase AlkB